MYRLFIALMMFFVSASVSPPQGNALPDNTITVEAYKLHGDCGYLKLTPYVDRSGIYYSQQIIDFCHYVDSVKMTTAKTALHFTGVDGYITKIKFIEVYPNGDGIPLTTQKEIVGWWWTGDVLPQGIYPPPIQ